MMAVTLHPPTNTLTHRHVYGNTAAHIPLHIHAHTHTHAFDCAACLPCRLTDIVFYTWSMRQPSLCWRVSSGRWTWWFWGTAACARNSFITNKTKQNTTMLLFSAHRHPTPPHLSSAGGSWNWKMSRLFYLFRGTHRRLFAYCWTKGKY